MQENEACCWGCNAVLNILMALSGDIPEALSVYLHYNCGHVADIRNFKGQRNLRSCSLGILLLVLYRRNYVTLCTTSKTVSCQPQ